jgi:hypothetical protein
MNLPLVKGKCHGPEKIYLYYNGNIYVIIIEIRGRKNG